MKSRIKSTLRFWYIYLIALAVVITGSIYYCDLINKPRNEETITLFVSTYSSKSDKLQSFLDSNSPSYLREINIIAVNPKSSDFDFFMVNRGLGSADIFILPESYVFENLALSQFIDLKQDVLNDYFEYTTDQYNKGILIHDIGDTDNDLITFTNENYEDEKYYLFYRMNSFHIGKLNNGSYDTALQFTKLLLNYE